MNVCRLIANKNQKLSQKILNDCPWLNFNQVQKLIRSKDVKVNGTRVKSDIELNAGDSIEVYTKKQGFEIEIIFEDENILIVNKPKKIEVVFDNSENLKNAKKVQFGKKNASNLQNEEENAESLLSLLGKNYDELYAVHRLDRNTDGLVVFAKNEKAKASLDNAFKQHFIDKFYLAICFGEMREASECLTAYLKKDSKNSSVEISDSKKSGFEIIKTNYKLIESFENCSLVEVELLTGRTHQIRAHMAHIGHFVIGDNKYGDKSINDKLKKRYQMLCAYKLKFNFPPDDFLFYLSGREFCLKNKLNSMLEELKKL